MANKENYRDSRLLKAFKDEQMKVHVERINPGEDDRVKFLYEAHADTLHGQDCIKTIYVYKTSSDNPDYTVEVKAKWDDVWDTDAEAAAQLLGYSIEG